MRYIVVDGGVLALEEKLDLLREIEAIIFDCDGTLVDVSTSFPLAGKIITAIYLDQLLGIECRMGVDYDEVFQLMKMLGGFNNIRNIISVILQAIYVELGCPGLVRRDLGPIDLSHYMNRVSWDRSSPKPLENALRWLISSTIPLLGEYVSPGDVEALLDRRAVSLRRLREFRELIGPISPYGSGIMTTLFSELYIGSEGIRRKYGVNPRFYEGPGFIRNERLIIEPEVLEELRKLAPRGLAIFSGKGRWEAEKILSPILHYFDLEASIFTGDNSRREMDKPNPAGLLECCKRLGAKRVLYVGDGGEDYFLVMKARGNNVETCLAAVLTNKYSYAFFTRCSADVILENVNFLPKLFKRP
ncbi:MAG: HAD-IA family hydrolase [Aigarchaeota archaeon]|nr:HAD-IA family hydrolase [Candidatus Wolframiiraptor gerlachensis]